MRKFADVRAFVRQNDSEFYLPIRHQLFPKSLRVVQGVPGRPFFRAWHP